MNPEIDETPIAETGPEAPVETLPGELTETQLEALLFVAERPLTRGEIAGLRCGGQRGSRAGPARIDARTFREEQLCQRGARILADRGVLEHRRAVRVGRVGVGAGVEQHLRCVGVPVHDGVEQRGFVTVGEHIDLRAFA